VIKNTLKKTGCFVAVTKQQELLYALCTKHPIMTRGKQWTAQQEAELKTLVESNANVETIVATFGKTPDAIIIKCQRLGLKLQTKGYVDTSIALPRELPSVEEALQMIAGALKTSVKPGLDRVEVQRLQAVATIAKTYKELLADYINYREIEKKLKEMEEENARLRKEATSNPSTKPDSNSMA
jgi:hypothetical protein